jgi:DNA polymerase III subunit epsilon
MVNITQNNNLVFIDVETTGLDPRKGHRIIEVGAIAMESNQVISEFQSLIQVNYPIPRHVSKIHGITNDMLFDQPTPEQVYPEVKNFISDSLLVAHNAKFDIGFLRSEFNRLNLRINNQSICTLEMSRRRYPRLPNYKLETIYRRLVGSLPMGTQRHRALDDARMVAAIWMAMEWK